MLHHPPNLIRRSEERPKVAAATGTDQRRVELAKTHIAELREELGRGPHHVLGWLGRLIPPLGESRFSLPVPGPSNDQFLDDSAERRELAALGL
jgi:hypothetical protein